MIVPYIRLTARLTLDTSDPRPPTKPEQTQPQIGPLPIPHTNHVHPTNPGGENAILTFIGTATTILEWRGLRVMSDPNFLHSGGKLPAWPFILRKWRHVD